MRLERDYEGKEGTRGERLEDWKFGGRAAGAHDSRQLDFVSSDENAPGCRRAHVAAMMKEEVSKLFFLDESSQPNNYLHHDSQLDFNIVPHAALLCTI